MLKIIAITLISLVGIFAFFYFYQSYLIYLPNKSAIDPRDFNSPQARIIKLQTQDKLELLSWYYPAKANMPTLLYLHGNGGNIGNRVPLVKSYVDAGYGVLLLEYRGYANNPGRPSEEGLYQDARAAMKYLHNEKIDCITLFGESLGTGVAVQLATEYPIAALILQSPFTSLVDVGQYHYPFLPVKWLLRDQYNSIDKIKTLHIPLLILYGQNDNVIPPKYSEALFQAANFPKEKIIIVNENGRHNKIANDFFINSVLKFLKTVRCE